LRAKEIENLEKLNESKEKVKDLVSKHKQIIYDKNKEIEAIKTRFHNFRVAYALQK